MKPAACIRTFTDRYPWLGPTVWLLSVEYFIVQGIAAAVWREPGYSWTANVISDLGNTACGPYGTRLVCSPLHGLMNVSFIILGAVMMLGSLFIYQEFRERRGALLGFEMLALAGAGAVLVGLFPENTIGQLHGFGALLTFVLGNVALVVLSGTLAVPRWLRRYTLVSGIVGLVALLFYINGFYFGLGQGTLERIVAYPQTIWLIIFGLYMTHSHYRNGNPKSA